MKYTLDIDINLPILEVIELFRVPENIKLWQPDLQSFDVISGVAGEVGCESKLVYVMGNKQISMTEVITVKNLPEKFAAVYETDNVWNLVENSFVALSDKQTRWFSSNEFKCTGFVKMMAVLMPNMFKNQSSKHLQLFKHFAENYSLAGDKKGY